MCNINYCHHHLSPTYLTVRVLFTESTAKGSPRLPKCPIIVNHFWLVQSRLNHVIQIFGVWEGFQQFIVAFQSAMDSLVWSRCDYVLVKMQAV